MNAIRYYRLAHWLYRHKVPFLPLLIRRIIFLLFNSDVPPSCILGAETRFCHGGVGVVLNKTCRIGDRVLIGQNATVGGSFGSGSPVIGNDVWIGPGVRILGDIRVGNNVVLGANAVVVKDIPDNCIALGIPARVHRMIPPGAVDTRNGLLNENV